MTWRWHPDPIALRRGARAALVIPLVFFLADQAIGDADALIFVIFSAFSLLVMGDFGGPRRSRRLAYLGAVVAGMILVALGTLVSGTALGGAAGMLVVAFAIGFATVFGGYFGAAETALLLPFVIATLVPAPPSSIPDRAGAWLLAGLVSTLAASFLWPRPDRVLLPRRTADALLAVATVVADRGAPVSLSEAREAARAARREYSAAARRPAGLDPRDRAYVELLAELEQVIDMVRIPFQGASATVRPSTSEGDRLTTSVLDALRASAGVLDRGASPDLPAIDEARRAHRLALDRWAVEQLEAGRPAEEVLDGLDYDHTLRVISYLAIGLEGSAVIAARGRPETAVRLPVAVAQRAGVGGLVGHVEQTVRTHLDPRSPVLHNSIRLAIGLALSVFLARTLDLQHAYWVVLGTISVLRSSALDTGRSTIQALTGSVIGIAVGGLFATLAGNDPTLMWIAIPFTVFLAAYAPTALGFLVGQAAFTTNLIVIFNLIAPVGWQVGLVRIEDVGLGVAVSVVAGALLWPRGARQELGRSVSSFYRAVAGYLGRAFDRVLGVDMSTDVEPLRADAVRAGDRATEALQALLAERGVKHLSPDTAAAMVTLGNQLTLAADALTVVAGDLGYRAESCMDEAVAIRAEVRALLTKVERLAGRLENALSATATSSEPSSTPEASVETFRAAALGCLRRADGERAIHSALALVIAAEWAQNLARVEADLEQHVSAAVAAARIPWWR
jgi:uncharacterized membrane protein YccC